MTKHFRATGQVLNQGKYAPLEHLFKSTVNIAEALGVGRSDLSDANTAPGEIYGAAVFVSDDQGVDGTPTQIRATTVALAGVVDVIASVYSSTTGVNSGTAREIFHTATAPNNAWGKDGDILIVTES